MRKEKSGVSFPPPPSGKPASRESYESRQAVLADISRGSASSAGLWAKGFAEEMLKGSRCCSMLKAGLRSTLGTAQSSAGAGVRTQVGEGRLRVGSKEQGWDESSANIQQWDEEWEAGPLGAEMGVCVCWEPSAAKSWELAKWVHPQLTLGAILVAWGQGILSMGQGDVSEVDLTAMVLSTSGSPASTGKSLAAFLSLLDSENLFQGHKTWLLPTSDGQGWA